jgi:hypothetical protein
VKIRFETTIDDVIAFNRFHFAHSPAWRKQVWKQTLMVPATLLALFVLFHLIAGNGPEHFHAMLRFGWLELTIAIFFLSVSILWAIYVRWFLNWSLGRNTRKFLAEGSNRVMFGWREMELVNGRLILNTELIQSSLDLRASEKIVSHGEYTYVYIAAASAYIIPMSLYPEEEYREFVAELREAWDNRASPLPMDDEDVTPRRQPDERIVER